MAVLPRSAQHFEERQLSPEVSLVELLVEDRFVHFLQFCESKACWKELESYSCVFQLVSQTLEGVIQDRAVVESEGGQLANGPPLGIRGIGAGPQG